MEEITIVGLTAIFTLIQYIFKLKIEKNIDIKIANQTAIFKENLSTKNQHYINIKSSEREAYVDYNKRMFVYYISLINFNRTKLFEIKSSDVNDWLNKTQYHEQELLFSQGHLKLFCKDEVLIVNIITLYDKLKTLESQIVTLCNHVLLEKNIHSEGDDINNLNNKIIEHFKRFSKHKSKTR